MDIGSGRGWKNFVNNEPKINTVVKDDFTREEKPLKNGTNVLLSVKDAGFGCV